MQHHFYLRLRVVRLRGAGLIIVSVLALVVVVAAAPPTNPEHVPQIVRAEFDQKPEGGYAYGFETENGIVRNENGELKEVLDEENKPHAVVIVRGDYSFVDNEGKTQRITYYADETGFHAEGDSIPKAPARR